MWFQLHESVHSCVGQLMFELFMHDFQISETGGWVSRLSYVYSMGQRISAEVSFKFHPVSKTSP